MRRRRCNSKVIITAKWMVCLGRLRVMQSRIINATTAFTQRPRSISRRCNHWEWHNETHVYREADADFNGGFLAYRKKLIKDLAQSDGVMEYWGVVFPHCFAAPILH